MAILERIDISDYMWKYHHGLAGRDSYQATTRTAPNRFCIKSLVNAPEYGMYNLRDIQTGQAFWTNQEVEYISSNLGQKMGSVYYFICKDCGHRVKHLYFYSYLHYPVCRKCCNLPYRQPSRSERKISRYISKHPEVAREIINMFISPIKK